MIWGQLTDTVGGAVEANASRPSATSARPKTNQMSVTWRENSNLRSVQSPRWLRLFAETASHLENTHETVEWVLGTLHQLPVHFERVGISTLTIELVSRYSPLIKSGNDAPLAAAPLYSAWRLPRHVTAFFIFTKWRRRDLLSPWQGRHGGRRHQSTNTTVLSCVETLIIRSKTWWHLIRNKGQTWWCFSRTVLVPP